MPRIDLFAVQAWVHADTYASPKTFRAAVHGLVDRCCEGRGTPPALAVRTLAQAPQVGRGPAGASAVQAWMEAPWLA